MITKRHVTKRAEALGVTVAFLKDSGKALRGTIYHEIILTAPEGQVFAGLDIHEVVISSPADGAPMEALYEPALRDLALGLEACPDAACEWCERI